jgi:hypothetical protein
MFDQSQPSDCSSFPSCLSYGLPGDCVYYAAQARRRVVVEKAAGRLPLQTPLRVGPPNLTKVCLLW